MFFFLAFFMFLFLINFARYVGICTTKFDDKEYQAKFFKIGIICAYAITCIQVVSAIVFEATRFQVEDSKIQGSNCSRFTPDFLSNKFCFFSSKS